MKPDFDIDEAMSQSICTHGEYQDTIRNIADPSWLIKCFCKKCGAMFSDTQMEGKFTAASPVSVIPLTGAEHEAQQEQA